MLRPALVLFALGGCDYALQLDHVAEITAPCGPYAGTHAIAIVGVKEPRQFSISTDEQLALVMGIDSQQHTRPIPLMWNGAAWEPDPAKQLGLDGIGIVGARLAPSEETPSGGMYIGSVQPAMNVWIDAAGGDQMTRLYFTGTAWTSDDLQTPLADPDFDTHAGNVVLVRASADPADRVRHTMLTKVAIDPADSNQILIAANIPPTFSLVPKLDRTRPLNEQAIGLGITLGDAVMTDDQAKLVYAAVSGGQSDIYASAQSALRDFAPGGIIAATTTPSDEVEPWIDGTCSKLYFRRIPAGSPNDPGQIIVAE